MMETAIKKSWTIVALNEDYYLETWLEAFLRDRLAQGLSKGTLRWYQWKLRLFVSYCDTQLIKTINQITPDSIREFLLSLQNSGHNAGGIHSAFRALGAFLYWWENEIEPEGWRNPIRKINAPRLIVEPLNPADPEIVRCLISTCENGKFYGDRDRALFLALLDTGCRASELLNIDIPDVNKTNGIILIRKTKSKRPRTVILGQRARKALRVYLQHRADTNPALWVIKSKERLTYFGLRSMVARRSRIAGVKPPELHSFRRLFALTMLRNGVDIYSLQMLMGHSDMQILRRYLKETDNDLINAHMKGSPANSLLDNV
jgi:site-specific recombinase XerD